jgi:hypothetical protein
MDDVAHYPVIVFVLSFLVVWLAASIEWFLNANMLTGDFTPEVDSGRFVHETL